jgi:hypothetical protein
VLANSQNGETRLEGDGRSAGWAVNFDHRSGTNLDAVINPLEFANADIRRAE